MAHSLLLCGLFAYICMVIMRFKAHFQIVIAFVIVYGLMVKKWLYERLNALVYGSFMAYFL